MRLSRNNQMVLEFTPMDAEKLEELEIMDGILKKADRILDLVTADLCEGVDLDCGRPGMSAEQVLRMALVKQMHKLSYEKLYDRVHDSIALRKFCRYEFELLPKPSTLHENIKKIQPETFEAANQTLVKYAKREGLESGEQIRIDSTAVETDIHHPTDSSLIWDGVRVITRMLKNAKAVFPGAGIEYHNRTRVVKKLVFAIANAKSPKKRLGPYKKLLKYADEVLFYARSGIKKLRSMTGSEEIRSAARLVAGELKTYADLLAQVINQTKRRVIDGEQVPADEKVVSFFETHTDIIEKGGRETVFGHKICLTAGKTSLVTDCLIEPGNPADTEFFPEALKRHRKLYGFTPTATATDGGFASSDNAEFALRMGVKDVSFGKRVGDTLKELLPSGVVHRLLMRFRAGIEGIISALKRGVGLTRCLWKGWGSFQAYVWSSILAHNVKVLTTLVLDRRKAAA